MYNLFKIKIPFYSKNDGNYEVKIFSDENTLLHSITLEADRGFNEVEYDLSINEKNKDKLQKIKGILIEKAKNDKYYLPKDLYYIQINSEKTELKIE